MTEVEPRDVAIEPRDVLAQMYVDWLRETQPHPTLSLQVWRYIFEDWGRAGHEPEHVSYKSTELAGIGGLWITPETARTDSVLVYFHGGGFAVGSSSSHRKLVGHLATAMNVEAFVADYSLAPEHPFPTPVEEGARIVAHLIDSGYEVSRVSLAGDSAGGNLAVATALRLRDQGIRGLGAVIGLSPWIDIDNTAASIEKNADTDLLVSRAGLEGYTAVYVGDRPELRRHPLANPLYANLAGLPPMFLSASASEALLDDTLRLADRAESFGLDCEVSIVDGMQHVFPFMAGRRPDADAEIARIGRWYRAL